MKDGNLNNRYNITIFAYNEENNIERAIESILVNTDSRLYWLNIILNGCTDNTSKIVKKIRDENHKINVIELALGDKCNAWNYYVHKIAPPVDVHFFVDADVYFKPNTFPGLFDKLQSTPNAIAIAGLPFSGRNKGYYRSLIIDDGCLFGNCYGIKNEFITLARKKDFKLPIGLVWIDSIITKAINCNITNQYTTLKERITYDLNYGYQFISLKPYSIRDIKLYLNRIIRYELGRLQELELNKLEFNQYPSNLHKINAAIKEDLFKARISMPFLMKFLIKKKLINIKSINDKSESNC